MTLGLAHTGVLHVLLKGRQFPRIWTIHFIVKIQFSKMEFVVFKKVSDEYCFHKIVTLVNVIFLANVRN